MTKEELLRVIAALKRNRDQLLSRSSLSGGGIEELYKTSIRLEWTEQIYASYFMDGDSNA